MSDDYYRVQVERDVTNNSRYEWYYAGRETVGVTVLDPIPANILLKNILWYDSKTTHHLNKKVYYNSVRPSTALEKRGVRTLQDLADRLEGDPDFLDNFVDDVNGFGVVSAMYLKASVAAVNTNMEYYPDADWPFTVNVPLPAWFRNEVIPFVRENMDEEEIKTAVKSAVLNLIEADLREELSDAFADVVNASVKRRRQELEQEISRMEEVASAFLS